MLSKPGEMVKFIIDFQGKRKQEIVKPEDHSNTNKALFVK